MDLCSLIDGDEIPDDGGYLRTYTRVMNLLDSLLPPFVRNEAKNGGSACVNYNLSEKLKFTIPLSQITYAKIGMNLTTFQ